MYSTPTGLCLYYIPSYLYLILYTLMHLYSTLIYLLYYIHLYLYSVYSLCIMYCIWFSYIVVLYYMWRVILYVKGYFTGMCVYTSKACFYSCIVNFITITLYVPETLAILAFHTYKYTYFKHCKYSSTPCNSK